MKRAKAPKPKSRLGLIFAALALAAIAAILFVRSRGPSIDIPQPQLAIVATNHARLITAARAKVAEQPRSADSWGAYGMALRAFDFQVEALRCFRAAESLDNKNPRWPYFISRILRAENPPESQQYLRRTVELVGNTPEAPRYYLAKTLAEEGNIDEAEKHATALLEAHPEFVPAGLLLAQIALARGDTTNASAFVKHCLNDPRTSKTAWALLATLQQRANDTTAAQESSRKSAAALADINIADPYEAEVAAVRGNPSDITDRVHTFLAARNLTEAAPLIDRLMREHPDFADTWLVRGRMLLIQKQLPAAEAALQKHLEMDPKSTQGLFQLGSVYLTAGKFSEAQRAFRRAIDLKNDFGPAWFNLAFALGRQGKWAEAAPIFQQAIRYNPEHIESYLLLADVQLQLGKPAEAATLLDSAARINPNDPRLPSLRQKVAAAKK